MGLSAARGEGQAPETKKEEMVWGRQAQGRLDSQHTGQTPMCCYAVPLPTLPWKT